MMIKHRQMNENPIWSSCPPIVCALGRSSSSQSLSHRVNYLNNSKYDGLVELEATEGVCAHSGSLFIRKLDRITFYREEIIYSKNVNI